MNSILSKWRELPSGVKASVALFFANVVSAGIAYVTTPLYTRLLTPDEYGQASVFLTWVQVFGIIAMFCLSYGVFNIGLLDYPSKRDEYSFSMLVLSNLITVAFSAVVILLYPSLRGILGMDFSFVALMCAIFFTQPAYNFYVARKRYEFEYKPIFVWSILSAVISPLTAIVCIFIFKNRLHARIFGAEIPLILIYIGFYSYITIKGGGRVKTKYWKAALLFNLPLIPHYLSTYLLGSSDKLMISRLIGDTATAYYSVAYSVASVANIVWSAVNSSLVPYTYEKCQERNYKAISAVVMPILLVFALVCVFVILLAPEVVSVMATADYLEAIYVIPPVVGGVFFQVQYYIYANVVYYNKKPKYVMYASVFATILNILLNYLLIPEFGYVAAGYTTIFCYLVQASLDYLAMRHVVNESVYNMRYLGGLSLGVIVVALSSNLLYSGWLLRYAAVGGIVLCAVIFRNRLLELFKAVRKRQDEEKGEEV